MFQEGTTPLVSSTISTDHIASYKPRHYDFDENDTHVLWKGPRKVACFCLLAVILPCVLVSVALLMRFVVNGTFIYHLSPSDMRLLDSRISTVWCQGETVKGNTTFTAYLTDEEPKLVESLQPLTIQRNLIVPDDHKEYWGFYLLKGSTFRIHTCARFKGGTLLIVRGRSHLEHCAYIGESDSAGDSDQFSSSASREGQGVGTHPPNSPMTNSKEEMGVILSKIRQYIRSRPKNYGKLKQNLADWMLIDPNNSLEAIDDEEGNSGDENGTSSPIPPGSLPNLSTHFTNPNHTAKINTTSKERLGESDLVMEHGTIHRNRRSAEIRKVSESGENGAFEDESEDDELASKKSNATSNLIVDDDDDKGDGTGTSRGIWEREHSHHRGVLNDTIDPNDGSDSESESSWSSSEEAMAKCEGVLASLLIQPNASCGFDSSNFHDPYYEGLVNVSGYYYFIFGSENEKRDNIIRAEFELQKFVYHLPSPVENCTDVKNCQVPFNFWSEQKLVVTVPQPPPNLEHAWDEVYVIESDCIPRASLYLVFVLTVPLLILLCAFQ